MIFDINSEKILFFLINRTMKRFSGEREKDVTKLLFLIMALNHLREWIAPGYKKVNGKFPPANTEKEKFFLDIWECSEFRTINKLCNNTKHIDEEQNPQNTYSEHGLTIDELEGEIDDLLDFDKGPAINYFVDGENVIDIINTVIDFYKIEWFEKNEGD